MMRALIAGLALCGCAALAHAAPPAVEPGQAAFDLGRKYRHGAGVARDSARAFSLVGDAARAGHPAAMFILSAMLGTGEGTRRDDAAARTWLQAAADLDHPEAMQQLAMNLKDGVGGFERDERRAAQLMGQVAHALKHRAHGH